MLGVCVGVAAGFCCMFVAAVAVDVGMLLAAAVVVVVRVVAAVAVEAVGVDGLAAGVVAFFVVAFAFVAAISSYLPLLFCGFHPVFRIVPKM